jgi:copper chaperone
MKKIKINGMKCQHCVSSVTKALASIEGVSAVSVNLESAEASYTAGPNVNTDAIKEAIRKIGFEPV